MANDGAPIPDGWRMVRLGDVAKVVGGSTPSRGTTEFWGGGIPWVVPSELTGLPSRYLTTTRESVTDEGVQAAGLQFIPTGSILLTSRATIGVTAINTMPLVTNQGFQNLVVNGRADTLWLYYCISQQRNEIQKRASGSTFREVSRDSVRSLSILLPPLPEQRRIAEVLDAIDDAIERTDAVIAATEQLRDSLLHELLTRGVPGWHTAWKDAPGVGVIPSDWEVVRLGEVARFVNGRAFRPEEWGLSGLPIVRIQNLTSLDAPYNFFNGEVADDNLIDTGDIVISWSASLETQTWRRGLAILNQHIFKVVTNPSVVDHRFLLHLLQVTMVSLRKQVHGTTMKHITKGNFDSTPVSLPPLAEQHTIADALDGVDAAVERGREERERLRAVKASTADALLSGRVRVGG